MAGEPLIRRAPDWLRRRQWLAVVVAIWAGLGTLALTIEAFGGRLVAGPRPHRGFRVLAVVPFEGIP